MSRIRLSFCIPTYNFGAFIGATLNSIVTQATEETEIVVVDGASTDDTADVVQTVAKSFPRLRYYRRPVNLGVDVDVAKAVDLANGDYCWLMSSDDVLAPRAIDRALHELASQYDVYLCNRIECDRNLKPTRETPWLASRCGDSVFRFADDSDLVKYLRTARSIGALFSYISSIITRRDKWLAVLPDERLNGSHYAHVYRLFSLLRNHGTLKYVRAPLVLCRGDNDSFAGNGPLQRAALDLDGFDLLGAALLPDPAVRGAFKAVMRRHYFWFDLTWLRSLTPDVAAWNDFETKLLRHGYSRQQLYIVDKVARSPLLFTIARHLGRTLRRLQAAAYRPNTAIRTVEAAPTVQRS